MSQGFWSDKNTEPKRAYRWIMNIGGIPQWLIKKVNKPNSTISVTEHQYLNHTFKYPGRLKWEKLSITMVDPVYPDASATLQGILIESGYHYPIDPNDTSSISKAAAIDALGRVTIAQIGAEGEVVEEWEPVNAWISSVKYGDLDYSSDNMTEITIELEYDFAQLLKSGPPVPPANA